MTRVLRQWVKWFYLLIATVLICLAVLVQSGRSFSPLVGDYQHTIAAYLSDKLNARVSFGSLSAEWSGLKPSLQVNDLLIANQLEQPIVALQEARMRLDIIGSLLNGRLVWSDLTLSSVRMAFVQQPDGFWHVHGLANRAVADEPAHVKMDALVDMLLLSRHIEFQRSNLDFRFTSGEHLTLDSPSVLLENNGNFHRLSLQVDVDDQPHSVRLIMEAEGDPRDIRHFRSRGYLALKNFHTSEPVAAATAFLLNGVDKSTITSKGTLDATVWFQSREGGEGYDLSGSLGLQTLGIPIADRRVALDGFSTEITGYWLTGGKWRLGLQNIAATIQEQQLGDLNVAISSAGYAQAVKVAVDKLDLEHLTNLLNGAGALGEGKLREVLLTLNPRGRLRNIELTLPPSQPKVWQVRANAEQVSVAAWRGVPALTGVDGYLQAGQRGGFINIDSRQNFSMHYSPTYAAPMVYDSARGQVAWHLQRENNQIYVNSGALEFRKGEEYAKGYMWLSIPWQRSGDLDLYLQVGAKNLNVSLYRKYTPAVVPASLLAWLDQSIGQNNSGIALTGGLVYRGTLNTKNPMARNHQLYLDVKDAELNYHAGWPALTQMNGQLLVNGSNVLASIRSATVYDSQVEYVEVRSDPRFNGSARGSLLKITGSIKGPASDGIRVLRESLLRQYLGSNLDSWSVQGDIHAGLDLAIPLGADEERPADAYQQVDIDLNAPSFELQNLNLQLSQVTGRMRYHSATGVSSNNLTATLFDEPVKAQMRTEKLDDYSKTLIDITGAVDTNTLAFWSKRPEALFLQGVMPYNVLVELNHRSPATLKPGKEQSNQHDEAQQHRSSELADNLRTVMAQTAAEFAAQAFASVTLTSNLHNVAVDLPEPFGKAPEEERALGFTLSLQGEQTQVDVTYNDKVQALLRMSRGSNSKLLHANIALATEASLSSTPQFLVSGYLPEVDLQAWKAVQARYDQYRARLTPAIARPARTSISMRDEEANPPAIGTVAGLPFKAELVLGRYELGSLALKDLHVSATQTELGWQLGVENPMVVGDVVIPNRPFKPLQVNLQRLHLTSAVLGKANAATTPAKKSDDEPALTEPQAAPESIRSIDPRTLPLADLNIDELFLDSSNYGNWSARMRPNNKGVVIDNIRGRIRGLTVSGGEDDVAGAKLIWQHTDQGVQTRFIGSFSASDMGDVLRQWQKPDIIESSAAYFNTDLFWFGAPQDFKLVELNGDMSIWMENGRFKRGVSAEDGLLRLMSILNFDTLARRMRLDFSDLYKSGLAYDDVNGKVHFNHGTLKFAEPLLVRTPSSGLQMAGTIDLRNEEIDARLVATLPVAGNLTFFAALATGLPAAAGVYLVSKLFKKQVDQATSMSYSITGSWDKPQIRFDRLFESKESLRDSVQKKDYE